MPTPYLPSGASSSCSLHLNKSFSIMGGVLATLPAYESDLFGPRHVGAIHSRSPNNHSRSQRFQPNVPSLPCCIFVIFSSPLQIVQQKVHWLGCRDARGSLFLLRGRTEERFFGVGRKQNPRAGQGIGQTLPGRGIFVAGQKDHKPIS